MPLLLLSVCGLSAQKHTGSLLWKVSGKDLASPSYILGTLHLKSAAFFDSIPGARDAFGKCSQVVGEIKMDDMAGLQASLQQAMMMPSDTTYRMLYSEEEYKFVSDKLSSIMPGATLDQLSMIKPAGLEMIVTIVVASKYFPQIGQGDMLDGAIQSMGTSSGKQSLGLETPEDQIYAIIDAHSLKRQSEVLLYSLKHLDENEAKFVEMIKDYNGGDINALYESSGEDTPYTPAEQDIMNKRRNDIWMGKLPQIMKSAPSFVVVGALHLAGPDGLLNQLEKAGYKVEKVK